MRAIRKFASAIVSLRLRVFLLFREALWVLVVVRKTMISLTCE